MKKILYITFLVFVASLVNAQQSNSVYQSYEMYLGDTVNRVDKAGLKQGRWIYYGKDKKGWMNRMFKREQMVEEGHYVHGKKHKLWKTYHHTGKLKSEITYIADVPEGKARFYNTDGKIMLEGELEDHQFVKEYYVYDSNGNKITRKATKDPQNSYLDFSGTVSRSLGKSVEGMKVSVERNDFEINSVTTDANGAFKLKLDLNFEYTIRFTKPGFNDQSILINAYTQNISDTNIYHLNDWKVIAYDNLAAAATTELFSFLINKPSGKIYFNKRKKKFMADGAYIHLFKKEFSDISETTKLMLAKAAEDNKKLEIENLRIESERKMKEIELLKQAQQLQQAEIQKKEAEIHAQKLEADKLADKAADEMREKKIKELMIEQQQEKLHSQQLEAQQQAKEMERLALIKKMQDLELHQKDKKLNETTGQLEEEKKQSELANKELDVVSREKKVKEQELKQNSIYMNFLLVGLGIVGVFSFFLIRNINQKKKANEMLAKQSQEIEDKSRIIEQKNIETEQSIVYAKRIQQAILVPPKEIHAHIENFFILYKPKDIVSGDFYFFSHQYANHNDKKGDVIIAAVDCTGHGVPGAFMSMVGNEKLKDAVDLSASPGVILHELNKGIKSALRQSGDATSTRDGMDLSLCAIPAFINGAQETRIKYAGANRPLWIIKKDSKEVEEVKATKCAIGGHTAVTQEFSEHSIELKKGDTFYLTTDGFADQFGGPNVKKLMTKKFKEILLSIQEKPMREQQKHLDEFIVKWRGDAEQVDDILVIGVRV
ncbi:MAG: SpoIIE family protein phosphatase [Bacteroidia bacterium]